MVVSNPNDVSKPPPTPSQFYIPITAPIPSQWVPNDNSSIASHDSFISGLEAGDADDFDSREFDVESYEVDLSSVVMRHEFENGRRFHKFRHGRYPLPNDDEEQERDTLKHALLLELTNGRLFYAPLMQEPQRIIDLGCGTGRWAMEVGEAYPGAEVIGVDLSPIMPEWLPPNVRFMVDDIEDEMWLHGNNFDLVHSRHVMPLVRSPETILRNSFKSIAPGGFIECTEFDGFLLCNDGTMPDDHPPKRFLELVADSMKHFGADWTIGSRLMPYIQAAGFVNVEKRTIPIPVGRWAKTRHQRLAGLYMKEILAELFIATKSRALPKLGYTQESLDELTAEAIDGLENYRIHAYINVSFYTGQKPLQ
ncbi:hypothetical protein TD95_000158 [Thielaviopsis punctulata]|uniref:Methyltransferase domain-containing protein n=1 Tax=Thielaviopsis punctulata TaxID=72032 RepID=A0A0F4Z7U6_9PEZI|nr:hypothetical protein TD95_000158 [Thielaviopsis punctulata]